jgi:hypothetical protein
LQLQNVPVLSPVESKAVVKPTPGAKKKVALPIDQNSWEGRTTVIYGDSTAGKTTNLYEAAIYLHQKYNKPIRLITAEDSTKNIMMPLIHQGIVKCMVISKITEPTSVMRQLAAGDWTDNEPTCAYLIEGLTTIAEMIQEDNREHKRFLGEQAGNSYTTESGEILSLPGQFSYGFVQLEMVRYMRGFSMLPGVERVIWTAHECKGQPDGSTPTTGPGLVGKAGTNQVIKHCGTLIHLDVVSKSGKTARRMYFANHPDAVTPVILAFAKTTVPLPAQEDFLFRLGVKSISDSLEVTVGPKGRLVNGLDRYLAAEDGAMETLLASYLTK